MDRPPANDPEVALKRIEVMLSQIHHLGDMTPLWCARARP
jgi:hypothetical protein